MQPAISRGLSGDLRQASNAAGVRSATKELTVLMPCLNEAETLGPCIDEALDFLKRSGIDGEVLVADNGSTDGSREIAETHGARVILVTQKGYGAALIHGIDAALSRYVVMGDADGSYDFSRLDEFVERLRRGADIVMGNRFKGGIEAGAMPFLHRYLGNPVLSFLGRLFFRNKVGDFHCGLRAFNTECVRRLRLTATGMEFATEMIVSGILAGYRIEEVPTILRPDGRSRPPHLRTWYDGWRHLRLLLLLSPKWLFLYPGVVLLAAGLIFIAMLLPGPLHITVNTVLDVHTFVAANFAVLVGIQLISFSILARRYAAVEGMLPPVARFSRLMEALNLERILLIALAIFVFSIGGITWALLYWVSRGFGPIEYAGIFRILTVSLTGLAVAIQLAASGFLASVLALRKDRPNDL